MEQKRPRWLAKKPESMLDWLLIVCGAITFYIVLSNISYVSSLLKQFTSVLTPFAAGITIAYIINPVMMWTHKRLLRNNPKLRWLAMLIGYVVVFTVVGLLCYLIVTQVMTALTKFTTDFSGYQGDLEIMLLELEPHLPESWDVQAFIDKYLINGLGTITTELLVWVMQSQQVIVDLLNNVKDIFFLTLTSLAASVYLLIQKDHLLRNVKILTRAFLPRRVATNVMNICRQANSNLSGFFTGKIIDSIIIGILTFLCMKLFKMEFAPVISIIVGVTNIIPVFGPFIGAIPGILLLVFVDPMQALGFAVLILGIQQLDGNVIGPKILGDSIGMDALWVLVSIVICGDLFGLIGMVIGVPLFATILSLVKELAEWCLRMRGIDKEGNPATAGAANGSADGTADGTANGSADGAANGAADNMAATPAKSPAKQPVHSNPGVHKNRKNRLRG